MRRTQASPIGKTGRALALSLTLIVVAWICESRPAAAEEPTASADAFPVFSHADYEKATGCKVSADGYDRSLRQIIASVVFASEPVSGEDAFGERTEGASYTRRHSRELFGPVFAHIARGSVCAHPVLVAAGRAAGFTQENAKGYSADAIVKAGEPAPKGVAPYVLTSRSAYIAQTGCLVSRSTYENLRVAFLSHVLDSKWEGRRTKKAMRAFLQRTGEGKRDADGSLAEACMTDTIRRIAATVGLLDADGRYMVE